MPNPLALIVCDATWEEPSTGKRTILGGFTVLRGLRFPSVCPIIGVYAALTGGRGRMEVAIQLVDVDEERDPIFRHEGIIEFDDPRDVMEIDVHQTIVVFPAPGEYRVQLYAAGTLLIERRIVMKQYPPEVIP